jgi:hypothetical protein
MNIKLLAVVCSVLLVTACGGDDKKKPAPVVVSSKAASVAASSKPASVAASSKVASVASSMASVAASSMASVAASSKVASSAVAANYAIKIDVTEAGTVNYAPQFAADLSTGIVAGKMYKMTAKFKASEAKTVEMQVNTGMDNSYNAYPTDGKIDVTTSWQTFEKTFTAGTYDDTTMQFQIQLGKNGTFQLWMDDLSITDADGKNEQIANGAVGKDDLIATGDGTAHTPGTWFFKANGQTAGKSTVTIELQ